MDIIPKLIINKNTTVILTITVIVTSYYNPFINSRSAHKINFLQLKNKPIGDDGTGGNDDDAVANENPL